MADGGPGPRTADVVDGVAWDYDPARERLSPLVSARRWFRDFPWELKATLVDRPKATLVDRPEATLVDQPPDVRDDPADRESAADPT